MVARKDSLIANIDGALRRLLARHKRAISWDTRFAVVAEADLDGLDFILLKVPASASKSDLTEREYAIAALVANGLQNKEIAAKLRISKHTVATHLRRIFDKLGVSSRTELAMRFLLLCRARGLDAESVRRDR